MLQTMARFAGVAGCAVSLLSTFQAPQVSARPVKARATVAVAGRSSELNAPIEIAPESGIQPAVSTVTNTNANGIPVQNAYARLGA